jgi:hypothetical protein
MTTYNTDGAQFSASGVVRYDNLIGENPFGPTKSTGYNNAVLSISRYNTDGYTSQLGFSGTGIYGRWFNNATPDAITPWRRFIMDDGVNTLNLDTPNVIIGNVSDGAGRSKLNITSYDLNINNGIVYNKRNNIWVAKDDMGNIVGPYIFTNKKMYYNSATHELPNPNFTGSAIREYYVWILEHELERFMNYDGSTSQEFGIAFTESGNAQDDENLEVAGHGKFTFIPGANYFIPNEVYTEYYITEYDSSDELVLADINTGIHNNGNNMRIEKDRIAIISAEACGIDIIGGEIDIKNHSNDMGNILIGNAIGTDRLCLNSENYIFIGDSESETNPVLDISASSINISGGKHFPTTIILGSGSAADEGYAQNVYTNCNIVPVEIGATLQIGSPQRCFYKIYSAYSYTINGFFQSSDARLKTFGDNIKVDFDALSKIRKAYFTWNDKPDTTHIGVSAQEVQEIYPEVVTETDGQLSVDYAKLSVVALAAVDELHKKNVELEERLAKLEALLLK